MGSKCDDGEEEGRFLFIQAAALKDFQTYFAVAALISERREHEGLSLT